MLFLIIFVYIVVHFQTAPHVLSTYSMQHEYSIKETGAQHIIIERITSYIYI